MGGPDAAQLDLERPLPSVTDIDRRSSAVAALVDDTIRTEELIAGMSGLGDMERLIGRIVYGTAGGRDLTSLRAASKAAQPEGTAFRVFRPPLDGTDGRTGHLDDIGRDMRHRRRVALSVREGGIIRDGFTKRWTACGTS